MKKGRLGLLAVLCVVIVSGFAYADDFEFFMVCGGDSEFEIGCAGDGQFGFATYKHIDLSEFTGGNTTNLAETPITNITNLTFENPSSGKIVFSENVDLSNVTVTGLADYVNISSESIIINSSYVTELNKSAVLSFYDVHYTLPRSTKNGVLCQPDECNELSYIDNVFDYEVRGFSEYGVVEGVVTQYVYVGGGSSQVTCISEGSICGDSPYPCCNSLPCVDNHCGGIGNETSKEDTKLVTKALGGTSWTKIVLGLLALAVLYFFGRAIFNLLHSVVSFTADILLSLLSGITGITGGFVSAGASLLLGFGWLIFVIGFVLLLVFLMTR